jgi:tRNA(Ile)-lysidine synthase TilS/MesJ
MIFIHEKDISNTVKRLNLPVVKSKCPADRTTERENIKKLLSRLEKEYPSLRQKIVGALQADKISGWGIE